MKNKALLNTIIAVTVLIVVGLFGDSFFGGTDSPNPPASSILGEQSLAKVTSIVDGDTIKVQQNGVVNTVRLIGINTPETKDPRKEVECFGAEATLHLKNLIENKSVQLESDSTQGDTDRYGRLLRYVFLDDGTNINLKMIEDGYAYEYTYSKPYYYQNDFIEAEEYARENQLGFWGGTCE